jgi:hypothetical protein
VIDRALLLAAVCALPLPLTAQRQPDAAPATVTRALQRKIPGVTSATWTTGGDSSWTADFSQHGASTRATFKPTGDWIETSTEIGAITMPVPVRNAVIAKYRGFQFVETRRIVRAVVPLQLFEIRLSRVGEVVWAQFLADGKLYHVRSLKAADPAPITTVAGTWRGTSRCLPGYPGCTNDQVVYHLEPVPGDSTGFDIQMNKIVSGAEEIGGHLACTLVVPQAALYCSGAIGMWHFRTRGDSLTGGLTLKDQTEARTVTVRRVP